MAKKNAVKRCVMTVKVDASLEVWPCVFCRAPLNLSIYDDSSGYSYVICGKCGARGPHAQTGKGAIGRWNEAHA